MSDSTNRGKGKVLKGLVAGLVGGLVASWTMNRFQDFWMKCSASDDLAGGQSKQSEDPEEQQAANAGENQDDTTVKAASAISEKIFGHTLTKDEKKIAGTSVHYSLGTGVGGLYGAVAEIAPEVTIGGGLPFGAAFWLLVDETAVPLLRLSKGPTEYPVSTHFYALTSHLVYGLTAELVRRFVRKAL